jgi:hypothetical protein
MICRFFLIFIFFITFQSCKRTLADSKVTDILLTKTEASKAIIKDDMEHYFEKITPIDAAIQMHNSKLINDQNYKEKFKSYLVTEAEDFTSDDATYIRGIFNEAIAKIVKINPKLVPKYSVAKVKTNHFGPSVYYTRGETIFIPENIFVNKKKEEEIPVMIHELWHILSEQQPLLKEKLYALIGFKKHGKKLSYPPQLASILLTNPDGADDNYALQCSDGRWVLPIIKSNSNNYSEKVPAFMTYLGFDLYAIDNNGKIECDAKGNATLKPEENKAFFDQIKDNTQYIIHPDEIIADNVMLAIMANDNNDFSKFSKIGKLLIDSILKELKSF